MATKTARMLETRNDLDAASREKLVALLNARLADTFDLYSQLKQAHWSVRGSDFFQLHELYDTIAESVLGRDDPLLASYSLSRFAGASRREVETQVI